MNILDILVSAISKTDNAQCGDIEEVIRGVPCRKSDTESKYRNRLEKAFVERLDVKPKRESGISRLGTRLDLFFVYKDVDYIITIKMGLTEQKVKNVLGEIVLVIGGWDNLDRLKIIVLVAGRKLSSKEMGYLEALDRGCAILSQILASRQKSASKESGIEIWHDLEWGSDVTKTFSKNRRI